MRILLQRVSRAHVSVDNQVLGTINEGLVLLVGFGSGDSDSLLRPMAEKILHLRLFPEGDKPMHRSSLETQAGVLLIPQFTLYADTTKGRRPDFFGALDPKTAAHLFENFVALVKSLATGPVAQGRFGAHMHVELVNNGPVTLMLDSNDRATR